LPASNEVSWAGRKEKGRVIPAFFFSSCAESGVNGIHRAGIYASTAVDAGISVNNTLVTRFTDGIHRAGFVACAAVNTFFGNRVGQGVHLLLFDFLSSCLNCDKLTYEVVKVQHKGLFIQTSNYRISLNC
jgi:hypothetical protein